MLRKGSQPNTRDTSLATTGVHTSVEELLRLRSLAKDLTLDMRKQSRAIMGGAVRTRYRGRGMEFAEVRPYQPGDDIRTIDWRVTARMQSPYTKLFQEEKERPIFVMVDQRAPMFFGSKNTFKSVFTAQLATVIAWIASGNNDRIGALVFGDEQQKDIRARRGKHAVLDLIHQLDTFNKKLSTPIKPPNCISLTEMLAEVSRVARPGSLVLLLSDFHDFDDSSAEPLTMLAKHSDVSAIHLYDTLEQQLPPLNQLTVSNGQQRLSINTQQIAVNFKAAFEQKQAFIQQTCINSGVQYVNAAITTEIDDFIQDLFSSRNKKRSRKPREGAK